MRAVRQDMTAVVPVQALAGGLGEEVVSPLPYHFAA